MTAPSFEEVRQRSYDVLGKVQEKLRSDWLYDDRGPTHEQVEAMDEARKHLAAAKAALSKAEGASACGVPEQIVQNQSPAWRRFGKGRQR